MRRAASGAHKAGQDRSFCPAPGKLLWAILIGIVLGVVVSIATVSRRSYHKTVAEASVVQQTLMHKIAQQVGLLFERVSVYANAQSGERPAEEVIEWQSAGLSAEMAVTLCCCRKLGCCRRPSSGNRAALKQIGTRLRIIIHPPLVCDQ